MTTPNYMTPNDIEVMIHYFGSRAPHPRIDAPAVRDAIQKLLAAHLIAPSMSGAPQEAYEATEGGKMYVEQLCATPLPVLQWTMDPKWQQVHR